MPIVSSSSSTPHSSDSTPATGSIKNSVWRPVISFGGALGLGLVLSSLLIKPVVTGNKQEDLPEIILPRETTMILAPTAPPGAILKGQIRLVADMVGTATVTGEVARQVVEPGTHVKKGDSVIEISTGQSERPAPAAENLQNNAEKSQIAASDAQSALAQKINIAQVKLRVAQERVDRSQAQVSAARDLVRRLQNGEAVSSADIPASFRVEAPAPTAKPRPVKTTPPVNRAGEIALRQAEAARDAATEGAKGLKMARQMLDSAQKASDDANKNLDASNKKVAEVEARFDDKKASGSDVEEERAKQRDAKSVVAATDRALKSATAEVTKREKAAADLQKYADKAAADAKTALKGATLFPQDEPQTVPATSTAAPASPSGAPSLDQAIKFAGAALDESRQASSDADKLHAEIAGYQRQVTNSNARIEETSHDLATAQQKVLDSVPRASFTPTLAPADGIVTWVARLAKDVAVGQSVFGIARGNKVGVHFEDKGELWRSLKPGTILTAMTASKSPVTVGQSVAVHQAQIPVSVKVTQVQEPQATGGAATVDCEVQATTAPLPGDGAEVLASVPVPGQKATLSVPASALVQSGSATYVAVLAPVATGANSPIPETPGDGKESSPTAVPAPTPQASRFHLEWKLVKSGRSDGLRYEVLSGLSNGQRIVAQPDQLEEMGFSPEPQSSRGVGHGEMPQEMSSQDILVRLTAASA